MAMQFADVADGLVGYFYLAGSDEVPDIVGDLEPERCYIHVRDGWAQIDALREAGSSSPFEVFTEERVDPESILAVLPGGAVLCHETFTSRKEIKFGLAASTTGYRARAMIGGVDPTVLLSTNPVGLTAHFLGVTHWARMGALRRQRTTDEDGRLRSLTVTVDSVEDIEVGIGGGRCLTLSAPWRVDGPDDRVSVHAPLGVSCVATRPQPFWNLLEPLVHVQDLLNINFGGFVSATPGSAAMHVDEAAQRSRSFWFWSAPLMVVPPGVPEPSDQATPLVKLDALGGAPGLRRWHQIARKHPRAVSALVNHYRHGATTPEQTLVDTATGIEHWVKHHRPSAWATGRMYANQLAARVGAPFTAWAGDADQWGSSSGATTTL